jgi:ABC-2 type transport system permease protein
MTTVSVPLERAPKVTQARVIRSELIKLFSLRSSVIVLIAAGIVIVGLGVVYTTVFSSRGVSQGHVAVDPVSLSLDGITLGQLILATLGIITVTSDYSSGAIRTSLMAVPRRLPVLWGKIVTLAVGGFVVTAIAFTIAFLAGQAILAKGGFRSAALTDPGVIGAILGSATYLAGIALLGAGVGFILRNTAAAITVLLGVLLLLNPLLQLLPNEVYSAIGPYLPSNAGLVFASFSPPKGFLPYWGGVSTFLGYLVAVTGTAALLLRRRDA